MTFIDFAREHGILIDRVPQIGIWKRYPTSDHPKTRNGAVKFMGTFAFVQNHAMDTEVSIWKSESTNGYDQAQIMRDVKDAENKKQLDQKAATNKAAWILGQCQDAKHEYLKAKGFEDEYGKVWLKDGNKLLVIPMRIEGNLVGCQTISEEGEKKFLFGQRTANSSFIFDNKGANIFCEGYATALSIRKCLKSYKKRYKIYVCFSANNMLKVARDIGQGYVVCDNDASLTGEKIAKEIGFPYWISDQLGEDFNDTHRRLGTFKAGSSLLQSLRI
jgi:putative DNA primase/helicase